MLYLPVYNCDERQLREDLRIYNFSYWEGTQYMSYRYDVEDPVCGANGQRISKVVAPVPVIGPPPEPYVQERYVRDGMRLVGVFDENNNLKSWNLGGAAGLVGRADPDPMAFEPLPRYYVTDHLGSIRAVVDQSGTVIEGRDYYPYGLTMPGRFYVQADTTREGFTGYEQDPETKQYYAGARFYNPALGRFNVTDRFAEQYPSLSAYQYAAGNPLIIIDVNGDSLRVGYVKSGPGSYHAFVIHYNEDTGNVTTIAEGMPHRRNVGIATTLLSGTIELASFRTVNRTLSSGRGFGDLQAVTVTEPGDVSIEYTEPLPIPEGMIEGEFVRHIENLMTEYNNNRVPYSLFPTQGQGNSNSLVGSILRKSGSDFQPTRNVPGWDIDIFP